MAFDFQVHHFYKCAATYPLSVNQASPSSSPQRSATSPPANIPALGVPIGVTDETSYFYAPGKPAKPHSCYVAEYDPLTKQAVVFLGMEHPTELHRFLPVYQGADENVHGHLTTSPPYALPRGFYLNFTTPLRVYLYALPPTSTLNSFKQTFQTSSNINTPPPETIPARLYDAGSFALDVTSRRIFWEAHRRYHLERRRLGFLKDRDEKGDRGPNTENDGGDSGMEEEGKGSEEKGETGKSGPDSGSEHGGAGNNVAGAGLKGVHYPLGTECCDDLEWDDEDFDHTRPRPIVRPSYHVRISGVTDSLGTEGSDDLEWDDEDFKIDVRRFEPVYLLAKHHGAGAVPVIPLVTSG